MKKKTGFSTRWSRRVLCYGFVIGRLLTSYISLQAQDIYNTENSLKYAAHLEQIHEFHLAAREYARLWNTRHDNDSLLLATISNYRKSAMYDSALLLVQPRYAQNPAFYKEYINILLLKGDYAYVLQFIDQDSLISKDSRELIRLDVYILQGDWKKAEKQLENVTLTPMQKVVDYNHMVDAGLEAKLKKPWLAFLLSVPVPGLGKIYAGRTWEGLSAFMITGVLAFSSSRGFQADGLASVPGWLFGSIATGFYVGNLYGSVKAAKKYNAKIKDQLHKDAENLVFSDN